MVVKKTNLSKKDLKDIFSVYSLGEIISSKLFKTGSVQTNILVKTEKGKFVTRIYEQDRYFESVLFEVNLLKYLKAKKYPCPNPLKNKEGKYIGIYNPNLTVK